LTGGIAHVGVTVADLERAVRFYTEGLGLDVAVRQTSAAGYLAVTGYSGVEIATAFVEAPGDGVRIELQEYRRVVGEHGFREPGTAPVGSSHICLYVDDVSATLERAEAAGGRRVTDPVDIDSGINDGGAAVYLRDPDGYTIELFQPPT
jgi:catechol 2,3-dioxygenase-like lactoylglutathione lyase family enzyme